MKIEKIPGYKNKLLKLKLIQTKIFNKKQYLNNIKIEDIEYRLKNILYIIYKYNILDKKILFVGSTFNETLGIKKILKNTKHIFIPKSIWIKGAISNKKTCFKHLSKNQKITNNRISKLLFQLKNNIDLIVLLEESNNLNVLHEGYVARIPVISLNTDLNIKSNKPTYKVPGNFQFTNKKIRDNFFYSLLVSVLKKGNTLKHLKTKKSMKNYHKNINVPQKKK